MNDDFDRAASYCEGISALAQYRAKMNDAFKATSRRCGSCQHWMKSRVCPREHNVRGMSHGPSSSDFACTAFTVNGHAVEFAIGLADAAKEFGRLAGIADEGLHSRLTYAISALARAEGKDHE